MSFELTKLTLDRIFILIIATLPQSEFGRPDHLSRSAMTLLSVLQKMFLVSVCVEE